MTIFLAHLRGVYAYLRPFKERPNRLRGCALLCFCIVWRTRGLCKFVPTAGTKMAVVSNFDLRLRPLLESLGLDQLFDALIISAEVRLLPSSTLFCSASVVLHRTPQSSPDPLMRQLAVGGSGYMPWMSNWCGPLQIERCSTLIGASQM